MLQDSQSYVVARDSKDSDLQRIQWKLYNLSAIVALRPEDHRNADIVVGRPLGRVGHNNSLLDCYAL